MPRATVPAGVRADDRTDHRAVVVGAGFAGIGAAVALRRAGIGDFVVLERAGDVGGTWRDNTYPGCACDIPSNLYSFSFAPNPDWTRFFPRQPEILDYLHRTVRAFGVGGHLRLGTAVLAAHWDDDSACWRVETSAGPLTARFLVWAAGALSEPYVPDIPGAETFAGVAFHSARWRHDVDLAGLRVAVVGTGASAVQIVPELAGTAGRLHVVQRTPPWIAPRADRPLGTPHHTVFRRFPVTQRAIRAALYWALEGLGMGFTLDRRLLRPLEAVARRHLARQVPDRGLRERLTPSYSIGCKRILYSDEYYPALQQPGVELLTGGLRELRPTSFVTTTGDEREVNAVVYATGFKATRPPLAEVVHGRAGRTLAREWARGMHAYLGTAVPGFPNFFMLVGPNTGLGHNSMLQVIESQLAYLVDCLRVAADRGIDTVEVRSEVERAYNAGLQRRLRRTVWQTGGCASWYVDEHGRNTTLWPSSTWRFRLRTRRFDADSYLLGRATQPRTAPLPVP